MRSPSTRFRSRRLLTTALFVMTVSPALGAAPPGYYDGVDASNAAALAVTLHDAIDDHVRFPYTSTATDAWDILEQAQEDPLDPGRILDVYRNESYPKQGAGNVLYDREHTWPRSFGFPNDGAANSAFTDAHMLHLADASYNGSRSNRPYGQCGVGCALYPTVFNDGQGGGADVYPGDDNWGSGPGGLGGLLGRWEVWSGRRGDIARALLYADIRYEGGQHSVTGVDEPDLVVTDDESLIAASNTGVNEAVAYMGMLSTLLEWHAQDPPDAFEQLRNDVVFAYQGNRNPFVDHPEWADVLFAPEPCVVDADCDDGVFCNGSEVCDGGACFDAAPPCEAAFVCIEAQRVCQPPVSGQVWINELHYENVSVDTGEFVEVAGTAGRSLEGWSIHGYNGATGATYASIALSGVIPNQAGCAGALAFDFAGLQNGAPDGLALVDAAGNLVQFLSYEGSFAASAGPASGEISEDIGVSQSSSTPAGASLQMSGQGWLYGHLAWSATEFDTRGQPNAGQTLDACQAAQVVPVPGTSPATVFLLAGLLVMTAWATLWRRQSRVN